MNKLIVALFNRSPYALQEWAKNNYLCINFDLKAGIRYRGNQYYVDMDLAYPQRVIDYLDKLGLKPSLIISFPPCDDLAVSGAKHFKKKRKKDPQFQEKAMHLFKLGETLAKRYSCPCITENPVSVASTLYRKPEIITSPHEYGGYLSKNDTHPEWPEYIAARDAYRKRTCYWLSNGFKLPDKKPVRLKSNRTKTTLGKRGNSRQVLEIGGKSEKTKIIRSLTPRGIFKGIYQVMRNKI